MAYFKRKCTKIRILCERAEQYEQEREALEMEGYDDEEIVRILQDKEERRTQPTIGKLPFDEREKVIRTLDALHGGLGGTHLVKSSTKTMMETADRRFQKSKARQATLAGTGTGLAHAGAMTLGGTAVTDGKLTSAEEAQILEGKKLIQKEKKREIQRMQDDQIKKQNYRDHLKEMFSGLESVTQNKESEFTYNFRFTPEMQKECLEKNLDHHLKQNDLKWYSEAYLKHKSSMRK